MGEWHTHSVPAGRGGFTFTVYCPDGYDPARTEGYPVVYLLCGGSADGYLKELDRWAGRGDVPPFLAVSLRAADLADPSVREIFTAVDRMYRTADGREGRLLAGADEGCREALRCALAAPSRIGAVTLLCPELDVEGEAASWIETYAGSPGPRLPFFIVGGNGTEAQAVALYDALHRSRTPASPAELRIFSGDAGCDVRLPGLREGLKSMLGGGGEPQHWSPVYDREAYRPVRRGTVALRHLQTASDAGESLPSGRLACKIYTPFGFSGREERRFAVLYLLHGSGGTDSSWDKFWPILDTLIEQGRIPPVLAAAPITGNSYWVDSARYGAVEQAVVHSLIPAIEAAYPAAASRESRVLAGFSMGGYGALRYALQYPDTFGGAILLSPAVQDGEAPVTSGAVRYGAFGEPFDPEAWSAKSYPAAFSSFPEKGPSVPTFIMAGDDDWNHAEEQDDLPEGATKYNMEVQVVRLYQRLRRLSRAELRIVGGGHTMNVWAHGFEEGLRYMFRQGLLRAGTEEEGRRRSE